MFRKQSTKQKSIFTKVAVESETGVGIDVVNEELQRQLQFIDLTDDDVKHIQLLKPLISDHIVEITDVFYDKLLQQPELFELIQTYSSVASLKKTFQNHILELFEGSIDETFLAKRKRIAHAHVKIGLKTNWYIGAFSHLQYTLNRIVVEQCELGSDKFIAISTIGKYINFEQQLVLEAYEKENERIRLAFSNKRDDYIEDVRRALLDIKRIADETDETASKVALQSQAIGSLTVEGGENAASSLKISLEGKQQLLDQNSQMKAIYANTEKIVTRMDELLLLSDGVKEVIEIVKRIGDQTNLLSINASIEAEQAGDRGKGFAVVATEIRKLSNQTKESAKRVSDLITTMNEQSRSVSCSINEVMGAVKEGTEGMKYTEERFSSIVAYVEENRDHFIGIENSVSALNDLINERLVTTVSSASQAVQQLSTSTASFEEKMEQAVRS